MKIVIVGGGQIGTYIAGLLLENNHCVKVIENRSKAIDNYLKMGLSEENLIVGDGTDIEVLKIADIQNCNSLVCVTGLDEVNLTVAMLAKFEYNVPKVIARVNNPKNDWLFNAGMGVDVKINQADIIGHMIADEMNYRSIMTLMKLSKGDFSIVRIHVDYHSKLIGEKISQIILPANTILIAIYDSENKIVIPHGDTIIEAGQNILAFGDKEAIKKLNDLFIE